MESENKAVDILAEFSTGARIDEKFEIVELLGRGAHGLVFKARHIFLDDFVAIKLLDDSSENRERRFQKEASILSTLDHPNIVKFHSFGKAAGKLFMVMEFLDGESLASIIEREGALNEARALPLFLEVCKGLKFAHGRNLIHRDIKPSNIQVLAAGKDTLGSVNETVKLLDFGIVKDLDLGAQGLTLPDGCLGSANYMSPEQCKSEKLDARSDIYSFACLMYEAMVGEPPMNDCSDFAVMNNHLNKIVSEVPAKYGISAELSRVILKCLARNPEDRFASVEVLMDALLAARNKPLILLRKKRQYGLLSAAFIMVCLVLLTTFVIQSRQKYEFDKVSAPLVREYEKERRPPIEPDMPKAYQQLLDWLGSRLSVGEEGSARRKQVETNAEAIGPALFELGLVRAHLGISSTIPDLLAFSNSLEKSIDFETRSNLTNFRSVAARKACLAIARFISDESKSEECLEILGGAELKDKSLSPEDDSIRRELAGKTMSAFSDLSRWQGKFADAERMSKNAIRILLENRSPDSLAAAYLELAVLNYMQGSFSEAEKNFLKAAQTYEVMLNEEKSASLNELVLTAAYLRHYGRLEEAFSILDKSFRLSRSKGKGPNHAGLHAELCRISLALGKKIDADVLSSASEQIPRASISDADWDDFECFYLELLKEVHTPKPKILANAEAYLANLRTRSLPSRFLNAAGTIYFKLDELFPGSLSALEKIVQEHEKSGEAAYESAEIRLQQGASALGSADLDRALVMFENAEKDCPKKNSYRAAYMRTLCCAKQMQVLSEQRKFDRVKAVYDDLVEQSLIDISKTGHNSDSTCSLSLSFFVQDIAFGSKVESGQRLKAINRQRSLLDLHKGIPITVIDAYANCALRVSREFEVQNDLKSARETLKQALRNLELYRAWELKEQESLLLRLLELDKKLNDQSSRQATQAKLNKLRLQSKHFDSSLFDSDFSDWLRPKP